MLTIVRPSYGPWKQGTPKPQGWALPPSPSSEGVFCVKNLVNCSFSSPVYVLSLSIGNMDAQQRPNKLSRLVRKIRGKVRPVASGRVEAAPGLQDGFRGAQPSNIGGDTSIQEPGALDTPPPYDDGMRPGDAEMDVTAQNPNSLCARSSDSQGGTFGTPVELAQQQASDVQSGGNGDAPAADHRTHASIYHDLGDGQTGTVRTDVKNRHSKAAGSGTKKGGPSLDAGAPPSSTITHVGSDGATSYYDRPNMQTTPGFEWASSSNGYDWESRKVYYGSDNPTMGQAYQRQLRQRELLREDNLAKAEAMREEGIRIAANERWVAHKA
ncbi:hypothetical protein GE09DRAFT_592746 [Coniochaeta sp. 2T2.1]|nr:hypothetical protein GE09DRAFT_592746 [Coniochaeta sp. 2T2.1]